MIFAFTLTLLGAALAACPSPYDAYDCIDDHSDPICTYSLGTYTCSAALGSSANSTNLRATSDYTDGNYTVYGSDSDSSKFCCNVTASTVNFLSIHGGAGYDSVGLYGSPSSSQLCGFGAVQGLAVEVFGYGDGDGITGSSAVGCTTLQETFWGGPGDDVLYGNGYTVEMWGDGNGTTVDWLIDNGDASDSATFSATMHGGAGRDILESYTDNGSVMYGDEGNDECHGGDGPDEMHGGAGSDDMSGNDGDDLMYGDGGNDTVAGNDGRDVLYGGTDDDDVCGGAGDDDQIYGGPDDDVLDDDDGGGDTFGGATGTDTCDSITTRDGSCDTVSALSYQCGSF